MKTVTEREARQMLGDLLRSVDQVPIAERAAYFAAMEKLSRTSRPTSWIAGAWIRLARFSWAVRDEATGVTTITLLETENSDNHGERTRKFAGD